MPKKETTATPKPPSEKPSGGKTITIDLPAEQAQQLRRLSSRTGMTQAFLRGQLSRSKEVGAAITAELRRTYQDWKEEIADDLFAGPAAMEEKGEPSANG